LAWLAVTHLGDVDEDPARQRLREPTGGAEIRMLGLRNGLRELGHDARLFASSAEPTPGNAADYKCFGTISSFRTLLQTANPFAYVAFNVMRIRVKQTC